jgi:predicted Fe-Mo cluster-binding NifX family protein
MKILLTTTSPSLEAGVDHCFGRGAYFLIMDTLTQEWAAHPNPGVNASGGAGTLAAQFASNHKVEAVISGDFGPNAYNALQAVGVAMYLLGTSRTGQDAFEKLQAGQLERVGAPTGQGHHGPR